jgi:hypothetical protein
VTYRAYEISFTFIFFAILTECLESNAGNRGDVHEFLGFIRVHKVANRRRGGMKMRTKWHEDVNEATRTASTSGLQ